jgi:small subunit ribosomal protein S8
MSITDLIGDAFTIIRNGAGAKKEDVLIPWSKLLLRISQILMDEGYIENFKEVDSGKFKKIKVYLKYDGKKSVFTQLKRSSTPGRRLYVKSDSVPSVLQGYGTAIVSTSSGIITDKEAREKGIGGEVIGVIW